MTGIAASVLGDVQRVSGRSSGSEL